LGEGEGGGEVGWEGASEAVGRVRKVLDYLVERAMTGVDSGVEVAHAILHSERYYEKYYKVGRSSFPPSLLLLHSPLPPSLILSVGFPFF
jgi:hypothetical protein